MPSNSIFVVEDEGIVAADIEDHLKRLDFNVAGRAASAEEAIERVTQTKPDVVLMDIVLRGEMDGVEAAHVIRQRLDIPVVFLTSHADPSTFRWACFTEPFGYILKPFDERELRVAIELAVYRHQAERRLRQVERWLATTLKSIGDGVIATDTEGRITFLNPVAELLTGWTAFEAMGRDVMEVFRAIDTGTGQSVANPVQQAMRDGIIVSLDAHTRLRARDGREVPIDDSAAPIRDDNGNVTGAVLAFRDCTERLRAEAEIRELNEQLEHRVRARTAELDAANKELESFSYSVAHDLRAPLRAIHGFAHMLAENHAQQLDAEAQRLLAIVCQNADRLNRMVDDFLNLARVGRQALRVRPVDMAALVQSVLGELNAASRQPAPIVDLQPLPEASGDETMLRQVWMNLLSNALKFTSKNSGPRIEVGASEEDGAVRYFVKDNGVGFNMDYADKLFGTFQRLHTVEEFEGTGVGLAIVQRIIQRHGGRVWAEAKRNEGATFYFTLPVAEKQT